MVTLGWRSEIEPADFHPDPALAGLQEEHLQAAFQGWEWEQEGVPSGAWGCTDCASSLWLQPAVHPPGGWRPAPPLVPSPLLGCPRLVPPSPCQAPAIFNSLRGRVQRLQI